MSDEVQRHAVPASKLHSRAPKSTIAKKGGKGARKGLGATKVSKIDFDMLEKNAEESDKQQKEEQAASMENFGAVKHENRPSTKGEKQKSQPSSESIRLAYEDLSIKEKQNETKLNRMTDKKKLQAERLGMGFGNTRGIGHSLDMQTIEQENPHRKQPRKGKYKHKGEIFYDACSSPSSEEDVVEGWALISPESRYKNRRQHSSSSSRKKSSLSSKAAPLSYSTIEPITQSHKADTSLFRSIESVKEPNPDKSSGGSGGVARNSRSSKPNGQLSSNQQQQSHNSFDGCKGISSDQMFASSTRHQQQNQQSYRRVEGRSGISSDDFYGRSTSKPSALYGGSRGGMVPRGVTQHVPDMYEIREGVKEGVRSMAGKMSSIVGSITDAIEERRF